LKRSEEERLVENNSEESKTEKTTSQKITKKRPNQRIKPRYGSELSLWSQFQFLLIVTGIASLFILLGVALTRQPTEVTEEKNNSSFPTRSSPSVDRSDPNTSLLPSLPTNAPISNTLPPEIQEQVETGEPTYKIVQETNLKPSAKLQKIIGEIRQLANNKNLSDKELSITLIDVNSGEFAAYQEEKLRFPASVVKLFWLVALYGQINLDRVENPHSLAPTITKMIKDSDNEAGSQIVDLLTETKSAPQNQTRDYREWENNRQWLNRFFTKANLGYQNLNISQKTFPIPSENLPEPLGYDLKIRGNNPNKPIRNKISTQQAAQLMYEIATSKAINPNYSQELFDWLKWDLATEERKKIDPNTGSFNPIRTFFGEALEDKNVIFASKAGWTSKTRQEVAYVSVDRGKIKYILAIFAEDSAYAKDAKIFPLISRLVYQKLAK
jgi:beta-lactamase class A